MKKIGAMKLFDVAELCDEILLIRIQIVQAIRRTRPDINTDDPESPYPIVQRLRKIDGRTLSVAQAYELKESWRSIYRGRSPNLVECEVFCNAFKAMLK